MSTSPDDLPESRGRAPRARAARSTTRARIRPEVVDAPAVDKPITDKPVVADEPDTRTEPRRARRDAVAATDATVRTDGNGAGKLPRATRRDRREPKVASAPTRAPQLERKFRQTVTKVDLWSVTKLALCFYISAMFVTVIALVALWSIADAAGIVKSVEKFIGDLLDSKNFHFLSAEVLRGAVLIGLVVVALQVVVTVIAASFYNIFAELFGGIEITVKEEEAPPGY
jgi:hypothetical protein